MERQYLISEFDTYDSGATVLTRRHGVAFMDEDQVDIVRISFSPTSGLVTGELQQAELEMLDRRLDLVDLTRPDTVICINENSPSVSNGWVIPGKTPTQ